MNNRIERFPEFKDFLKTEVGVQLQQVMSDKNNVEFVSGSFVNLDQKMSSLKSICESSKRKSSTLN